MTLLVVDASCLAAWFLPSQRTASALSLRARLGDFDLIAPSLLRSEVRALLLRAERRGALAAADSELIVAEVAGLGIQYGREPDDIDLAAALDVARATGLTFYDSLYFQLAVTEGAGVASRDGAILGAAVARGIPIEDCR